MSKKLLFSMLLALVMVFSAWGGVALAQPFADMPDDWSTSSLEKAVENGIFQGIDGKIAADTNLTRAQMAAIISRAFGTKATAALDNYSDVDSNAWYYAPLQRVVAMKAFLGADGKLMPNAAITREEAFTVIARAFHLQAADTTALAGFADAGDIAPWAKTSVAAVVAAGYAQGSDGQLRPKDNITRAEFAVIIDKLVASYINKSIKGTDFSGNVLVNAADISLNNISVKGDLIIGDGAGDSDIYLNNVNITGRLLIRGGGGKSIHITGTSHIGTVVVAKNIDGEIRVVVQDGATVNIVYIEDGQDTVFVEGAIDTLIVDAKADIVVQNAEINNLNITSEQASLDIAKDAAVTNLNIAAAAATVTVEGRVSTITAASSAEKAAIIVADGGKVTTINAKASGTSVSGSGAVGQINVSANDVSVDTVGTKVVVDKNVSGTAVGGENVAGGTTGTSQAAGGVKTTGSSGSSSTPPTPTPPAEDPAPATLFRAGQNIGEYDTIMEALDAAADGDTIKVFGDQDIGFTEMTVMGLPVAEWYLPITKSISLVGIADAAGNKPQLYSSTKSEGNEVYWNYQNFITIVADSVTIEGFEIVSKRDTNKVIEILGKNFTLRNCDISPNPADDAIGWPANAAGRYAGTIYLTQGEGDNRNLGNILFENVYFEGGIITYLDNAFGYGTMSGTLTLTNTTIDASQLFYYPINFGLYYGNIPDPDPEEHPLGVAALTFVVDNFVVVVNDEYTADVIEYVLKPTLPPGSIVQDQTGNVLCVVPED